MDARYARKARATLALCTGPAAVPPIGHWRCVCPVAGRYKVPRNLAASFLPQFGGKTLQ
jgi:hypothetical protein